MSNLAQMTKEELQNLLQQAQNELAERREDEIRQVKEEIQRLAKSIGVRVYFDEPSARKVRKSSPATHSYRNPAQPSQTWAGRGKRPHWLTALIAQGHKLEDLLVG